MAANMARNICLALKRLPISSVTIWMDSLVALFWISNPARSWKVFVANRVRKIASITAEFGIHWKYCPTKENIADLGSRGASVNRMQTGGWFQGPEWLLDEVQWPEQPKLASTNETNLESIPQKQPVYQVRENVLDEWDSLLDRNSYWRTLRVTAWIQRFVNNCLSKKREMRKKKGPIDTSEVEAAKNCWIRRVQRNVDDNTQFPGWRLVKDEETGIIVCNGRIPGYRPVYVDEAAFVEKLIQHIHEKIMHLGVANTMATIRDNWWIPHLRSKVKKVVNRCNNCKVFSTKPFGAPTTAQLPEFRTNESRRPFEVTGVDFAGPLICKLKKNEVDKCYVVIFTCAASRAVHLELTHSQSAEEFQEVLNSFITRRTRPRRLISDNAMVFKATASWIRKLRRSEILFNYLAAQEIHWTFNLAKSPWWGGIYERLIQELKKTLYKTLGKTHLTFRQLRTVILDIERNLNNRPLTYIEGDQSDQQVLTPNVILWGQNAYTIESEGDFDEEQTSRMQKRLGLARQHAWSRWQREYVHGLMEFHRINKGQNDVPQVGEVVLVVGEEKNRGLWMKARVLRHVKGKDGVIRGAILLHKGNHIERPIQLLCPLEIRSPLRETEHNASTQEDNATQEERPKRRAAKEAGRRIQEQLKDDE